MHGFYANAKTVEIAHCWVRKMFYVTLLHFTTLESTHVVRILTYTQNSEWVLCSFLQNSDLLSTVYSHVILGAISQNLSVRRSADLGFLTYTVIKQESQSCREGHPRSRLSELAPWPCCVVSLSAHPFVSLGCTAGKETMLPRPPRLGILCFVLKEKNLLPQLDIESQWLLLEPSLGWQAQTPSIRKAEYVPSSGKH